MAGEARLRQDEIKEKIALEDERVTFDFNGPKLYVPRSRQGGALLVGWETGIIYRFAAGEVGDPEGLSSEDLDLRAKLLAKAAKAQAPKGINWGARAAKAVIGHAVRVVHGDAKKLRRLDRERIAAWQDRVDFEADDQAEATVGDLEWLKGVLTKALDGPADEKGDGVPIELSSWLVGMHRYVSQQHDEALLEVAAHRAKAPEPTKD